MLNRFCGALCMVAALNMFTGVASADLLALGYISYDVTATDTNGNPIQAEFDITNQTGSNASPFPLTDFPVVTPVSFDNLSLSVTGSGTWNFSCPGAGCPSGASNYFNLVGSVYDGTSQAVDATDQPFSATLTGNFSTTHITLNNGVSYTISPNAFFDVTGTTSPTITDTTGLCEGGGTGCLQDQDLAVIYAQATPSSSVPEPGYYVLLGAGLFLVVAARNWRRTRLRTVAGPLALIALCLVLATNSPAAGVASTIVQLTSNTAPTGGTAGVNLVNITASGVPDAPSAITPANVKITMALSCGGASVITTQATKVAEVVGSTERFQFLIPGSLTTSGAYYLTISDTADAKPFHSAPPNCAQVQVTLPPSQCAGQGLIGIDPVNNVGYAPLIWPDASGNGQIAVVNLKVGATNPVIKTISLVGATSASGNDLGIYAETYNPNNKTILAAAPINGQGDKVGIWVIDTVTQSVVPGSPVVTDVFQYGYFGGILMDVTHNRAFLGGYDQLGILDTSTLPGTWLSGDTINTYGLDSLSFNPATGLIFISDDGSNETIDTTKTPPFTPQAFNSGFGVTDGNAFDPSTNILLLSQEVGADYVYGFNFNTFASGNANVIRVPGTGYAFPIGEGPGGEAAVNCSTHRAVVNDEFGSNVKLIQLPTAPVPATIPLDNKGQPGTGTTPDSSSVYTIADTQVPNGISCNTSVQLYLQGDPSTGSIDPLHNLFYGLAVDSGGYRNFSGHQFLVQMDLSQPVFGACPASSVFNGDSLTSCPVQWTPKATAIALPGGPACP